jgi:hypothetical protein
VTSVPTSESTSPSALLVAARDLIQRPTSGTPASGREPPPYLPAERLKNPWIGFGRDARPVWSGQVRERSSRACRSTWAMPRWRGRSCSPGARFPMRATITPTSSLQLLPNSSAGLTPSHDLSRSSKATLRPGAAEHAPTSARGHPAGTKKARLLTAWSPTPRQVARSRTGRDGRRTVFRSPRRVLRLASR